MIAKEGASIRPSGFLADRPYEATHGLQHPRQPQPPRGHPAEGLSRQSVFLRDLSNRLAAGICRALLRFPPCSSPGSAVIISLLGALDAP
jgi:hypothetical protein